MPRPVSTPTAVVAGRRMRRPYEFEVIVRRGEALPRPLSTPAAVVAGRRMHRPYEFEVIVHRGEALPRPLSTYVAVVCRATHASPLRTTRMAHQPVSR